MISFSPLLALHYFTLKRMKKNHIFISKKRGTLKPTHTENDCDDIKVYFEERARKAVKMRKGVRERWKEKDRLG